MTRPTFEEFFAEANGGRKPFPWQIELSKRLVDASFPTWIRAATGLGKTAFIDAWVYALASDSETNGTSRKVPTRLFFVVNRRGIVDDATKRGRALAEALTLGTPAMTWAREQLLSVGYALENPLEVCRMRGGVSWDWLWLRQMDQPALIATTVDQFGSRLLFRGYGVGDRLLPIDTALVANDSLVVLDEAHLSQPLIETIEGVHQMQASAAAPVLEHRPSRLIRMTATPPPSHESLPTTDQLSVSARDGDDPVAGPRLRARKLVWPIEVVSEKPRAEEAVAKVAKDLTIELLHRVEANSPTAVVIVNTVKMARSVFDLLQKDKSIDVTLLVGTSRPLERNMCDALWRSRIAAGRNREVSAKPFVLVATQTVEVGADIDADVLVTEACSLDALVQRLGRLDRFGDRTLKHGQSEAVVLFNQHRHRDESASAYAIYQHAAAGVFDQLREWCGSATAISSSAAFDFQLAPAVDLGPLAIADRIVGAALPKLLRAPVHAPVLLRTAVRGWAQTSPIPVPDRPVAPYLHGPGSNNSDVSLLWRDLQSDLWSELLTALAPVTEEMVTLRRWEVLSFLTEDAPKNAVESDDAEQTAPEQPSIRQTRARVRFAVFVNDMWTRFQPSERLDQSVLESAQIIVTDSAAGGHDQFSWNPDTSLEVLDVADLVGNFERRPLSLSARRLRKLGFDAFAEQFELLLSAANRNEKAEALSAVKSLHSTLAEWLAGSTELATVKSEAATMFVNRLASVLQTEISIVVVLAETNDDEVDEASAIPNEAPTSADTLLLVPRIASWRANMDSLSISDSSDAGTSQTAKGPVLLSSHLNDVGDRCAAMVQRLGLEPRLANMVIRAARLHDLGKADRRFQTILRNGDWVEAELAEHAAMLAKSSPGSRAGKSDLPKEMRWPRGLRHEAVSTLMMQDSPACFDGLDELERELLLHLVGAHHGCNRPLFPPVLDPEPGEVSYTTDQQTFATNGRSTSIDWDHARSFNALNERYSAWGLAYLESLVRMADLWISSEGK